MERKIFTFGKRPPLVCSLSDPDVASTICTIRNAIYDGADGFLLHMEKLREEFQNRESLQEIFRYTKDKPILTLNYRYGNSRTDEQLAQLHLEALEAGAGCCDIMADMFGQTEPQITYEPEAIRRQMELIDKIHSVGGQVLMSSHLWKFYPTDFLMETVLEMKRRGADIVKIAMRVDSQEEMIAACQQTALLKEALGIPFLMINMGEHGKAHRVIGPVFGSCMLLCVQRYTPNGHKEKPLLRACRDIYNNFDY